MSRLGDLETAVVNRLAGATISGSPAFAVVKGASGDFRAAMREALLRERASAAYVSILIEPTAPETWPERLGAQVSVFLLAKVLRQGSNPRLGDSAARGAFTLIDTIKNRLDNFEIVSGIYMQNLDIVFREADERFAVYELRYRAWPVYALSAPGAPLSLATAPPGQAGMMKLVWQPPTESVTTGFADFYRMYKKGPGESSFKLFETGVKTPTFKIFTAQAFGTTVEYYVTAVNISGEGPASNTLTVEA